MLYLCRRNQDAPHLHREVPHIASKGAAYRHERWHIKGLENRHFLRQSARSGSATKLRIEN